MRMSTGAAVAGVLGIGAALWYLYDRERGPSRRAALRNRLSSLTESLPGWAGGTPSVPRAESIYLRRQPAHHGRWSPAVRTVGSLAGAGLAFYGVRHRGNIGRFATGLGTSMFRRRLPWRRRPEPPQIL
jgi:hypothetical protein